jgi:NAD(P)-dependent dehydrogenase (short-subunit alcohol dehydrogenase family)
MQGRRILVVGAGQRRLQESSGEPSVGNGRAIAMLAARESATVICLDVSETAANETCALIAGAQGRAFPLVADVSNPDELSSVLPRAAACAGGLDGLVLNVSVTRGLGLLEQTAATWDAEFAVNLRAHMLLSQAAIEQLQEGSSIVITSGLAALRANGRNPAYESSKAAQIALMRSVAMAGQDRGIRCNAVVPGLIDTPMGQAESARRGPSRTANLPFTRQGTAWEVAYGCLYLLSNESSYVNGQSLVLDGGVLAGVRSE